MVAVQKNSTPVLLSLTWALSATNFKIDTFSTITVLQETDKTLVSYIALHYITPTKMSELNPYYPPKQYQRLL